jgi:hypothetical protein
MIKCCDCVGLGPLCWFFLATSLVDFVVVFPSFTFVLPCNQQMATLGMAAYQCTPLEINLTNQNSLHRCMLAILQAFLALMPRIDVLHVTLTKSFWTCYSVFYWVSTVVHLFLFEANEPYTEDASLLSFHPCRTVLLFAIFLPCWWFHPSDINNGYIDVGDSAIEV